MDYVQILDEMGVADSYYIYSATVAEAMERLARSLNVSDLSGCGW